MSEQHLPTRTGHRLPDRVVVDLTYREAAAIAAGFVAGVVYDLVLVAVLLGVL